MISEKFQSGFRSLHSTESALIRVTNDLCAADAGYCSVLLLLDLSTAFNTADHTILVNHLKERVGINDTTLKWIHSYLVDRSFAVVVGVVGVVVVRLQLILNVVFPKGQF